MFKASRRHPARPSRILFETPQMALNAWVHAIRHHSHQQIFDVFYADMRFFKPTLRPDPIPVEQAHSYFEELKCLRNFHVRLNKAKITPCGNNRAIARGIYTFHFIGDDGHPQKLRAFFVFQLERQSRGWRMSEHISKKAHCNPSFKLRTPAPQIGA